MKSSLLTTNDPFLLFFNTKGGLLFRIGVACARRFCVWLDGGIYGALAIHIGFVANAVRWTVLW